MMQDQIHIRPATLRDKTAVTALFRRSYPRLLTSHYDGPTLRAALPYITTAQPALLECGTYFVAQDDTGQIIGAGGWTDISPARGVSGAGEGHMRHVATDPARVRAGVGRRLLRHTIASARAAGIERMHCMSTRTARVFYEVLGFVPVGEVELTLAPGVYFPAVQMVRGI